MHLTKLLPLLLLAGCVNGIPPPDGWDPVKVEPCQIDVYVDGRYRGCMSREKWQEWMKKNTGSGL